MVTRARVRATITLMAVMLCLAGCVRAGFDVPESSHAESGIPSQDTGLGFDRGADAANPVTHPNDRCDQAKPITITSPKTLLFIDTSQATDDYNLPPCCAGVPDVVARLDEPPSFNVSCQGGGRLCVGFSRSCPPTFIMGKLDLLCQPGLSGSFSSSSPGYLIICRDPAAPATLVLE